MIATRIRRSLLVTALACVGALAVPAMAAAEHYEDVGCPDTSTAEPDETASEGAGVSEGSTGSLSVADTSVADHPPGLVVCASPDYTGGGQEGGGGWESAGGGAGGTGGAATTDGGGTVAGVADDVAQGCDDSEGGGGGVGDGAGVLAPDPDSDSGGLLPETGAAEPDEGLPAIGSTGAAGAAAIGANACSFLDTGAADDIATPTRIDAGAGAAAAAGNSSGWLGAGVALSAMLLEGVRRRWRR